MGDTESKKHEKYIAARYRGERSATSGASIKDRFDDKSQTTYFEAKERGNPQQPLKSQPQLISWMEKIRDAAFEVDKAPALALRFYYPDSPMANLDGYIDMIVRLINDDVERDYIYEGFTLGQLKWQN